MLSNGFLPGWEEANEMWPGVCQSCVSTTFWKDLAILLMSGMISSPAFTARLPPGRKQFCTSTTTRAVSGPGLILPWARAPEKCDGTSEASDSPPAAASNERRERSCMGLVLATTARMLSPAYDGAGVAGSAMVL